MGELFTIIVITVLLINLFIFFGVKSDWRDLRRERDKLRKSWDEYFAESRKYQRIKSVTIEYMGGGLESIKDVKSYSICSKDGFAHFYNENGVAIKSVKITAIKSIKFIRVDEYTAGERNLFDDF